MKNSVWVVDGENPLPKSEPKQKKLPHRDAFEITEKMSKGQVTTAQWFNEMRERLIELGEMEAE